MTKNLNKLAREVIEKNQYVTIATSDIHGKVWISPVVYTYDKDYNFYFLSMPSAKHCKTYPKIVKLPLQFLTQLNLGVKGWDFKLKRKLNHYNSPNTQKLLSF